MDQKHRPDRERTALDEFLGARIEHRRARAVRKAAAVAGVVLLAAVLLHFRPRRHDSPTTRRAGAARRPARHRVGDRQPAADQRGRSRLGAVGPGHRRQRRQQRPRAKGQVLARLDTSRLQDAIVQSRAALQSAQASVAQAQASAQQAQRHAGALEEVRQLVGRQGAVGDRARHGAAEHARAIGRACARPRPAVAQARAQLSSDQTQFVEGDDPLAGDGRRAVAPGRSRPDRRRLVQRAGAVRDRRGPVQDAARGEGRRGRRRRRSTQGRRRPSRSTPFRAARSRRASSASTSAPTRAARRARRRARRAARRSNTVVSYTAVLAVDNGEGILRPGMTATAEIVTSEKRNVLLVPNAALRFSPEPARPAAASAVASRRC